MANANSKFFNATKDLLNPSINTVPSTKAVKDALDEKTFMVAHNANFDLAFLALLIIVFIFLAVADDVLLKVLLNVLI